ncbi:MAG: hypothetical protein AB1631_08645 [Acidobacteriota bacterium]
MKHSSGRAIMLGFVVIALGMISALPTRAHLCACCAEWGEWSETTSKIADFEAEELNRLKFSQTAKLHSTAAFPEDILGLSLKEADMSEDFRMNLSRSGNRWTLTFKSSGGQTGALILTLPAQATRFQTDPMDGKEAGAGGPWLYKEFRLRGQARGTGFFAGVVTPTTKFRLIFHGRGNRCLAAEDFKGWSLNLSGPRARCTFYGSFAK